MNSQNIDSIKDRLAEHIVDNGYSIFGGYVYKTKVNGDKTLDIDVDISYNDPSDLIKSLEEKFSCYLHDDQHRDNLSGYTVFFCPDNPAEHRFNMQADKEMNEGKKKGLLSLVRSDVRYEEVKLFKRNFQDKNPIFKLHYKKVNGIPTIVDEDGNEERCRQVITNLRNHKFQSWPNMRPQDKRYFASPLWTDIGSFRFKIRQMMGFEEE